MTKITVFGGTGYAGSAIVDEAVQRDFAVTSVSRSKAAVDAAKVTEVNGSVLDEAVVDNAIADADVVVGALSPRGELEGKLFDTYTSIAAKAAQIGARFIVVGGFGSLRPAADAPQFVETDDFPAEYKPEALELSSVLSWLLTQAPSSLDWVYVSPAADFGVFNPGEKTGEFRVSGNIATFAEDGSSKLSSQDLAIAIVDEINQPSHHRAHISVAY